jgi:hypothetical protein
MAVDDVKRALGEVENGLLDFFPAEDQPKGLRLAFTALDVIAAGARPPYPGERVLSPEETKRAIGKAALERFRDPSSEGGL